MPENCRDKYTDVVNEINALDPQNTLGYAKVLTRHDNFLKQNAELETIFKELRVKRGPEFYEENIVVLKKYLETPDLEPELAQMAWRALGDTYVFQRRFKDVYEAYKKAYEAAPDSRLAPRLKTTVEHYEVNILPAVERGEIR